MPENLKNLVAIALEGCYNGVITPELKTLYNMPYRKHVDWQIFPLYARPIYFEGEGHEG